MVIYFTGTGNSRFAAEKIAEIKGVSLAEAEDATYRNACDFYRLPY